MKEKRLQSEKRRLQKLRSRGFRIKQFFVRGLYGLSGLQLLVISHASICCFYIHQPIYIELWIWKLLKQDLLLHCHRLCNFCSNYSLESLLIRYDNKYYWKASFFKCGYHERNEVEKKKWLNSISFYISEWSNDAVLLPNLFQRSNWYWRISCGDSIANSVIRQNLLLLDKPTNSGRL